MAQTGSPAGAPATPLAWRVLVEPAPRTGSENMAVDHGLADALRPRCGVLRFYRWSRPTVSLGRNQPAAGRYDRDLAREMGVDFVRRPTGGRAVLHDGELTYSLVVPARGVSGPKQVYQQANQALAAGLTRLGAEVKVVSEKKGSVLPPDAGPCFRAPAPGEVTALGRKVVGSAQVRLGEVLLQHGSVLLEGSQEALVRLGDRPDPTAVPPVTVSELLGRIPAWEELTEALVAGFADSLGGTWERSDYFEEEIQQADERRTHYASDEWTWRR